MAPQDLALDEVDLDAWKRSSAAAKASVSKLVGNPAKGNDSEASEDEDSEEEEDSDEESKEEKAGEAAEEPPQRPKTAAAEEEPAELPVEDKPESSSCVSVVLQSNHISRVEPGAFALVARLRALDLQTNHLTSLDLDAAATPRLMTLSLRNNRLAAVGGIGALASLLSLDLSANQLSSLDGIESLVRLRVLVCKVNRLSGAIPAALRHTRQLVLCDLSHNALDGSDVAPLAALRSLSTLRLNDNQLPVAALPGLEAVLGGLSLHRLSLYANPLAADDTYPDVLLSVQPGLRHAGRSATHAQPRWPRAEKKRPAIERLRVSSTLLLCSSRTARTQNNTTRAANPRTARPMPMLLPPLAAQTRGSPPGLPRERHRCCHTQHHPVPSASASAVMPLASCPQGDGLHASSGRRPREGSRWRAHLAAHRLAGDRCDRELGARAARLAGRAAPRCARRAARQPREAAAGSRGGARRV